MLALTSAIAAEVRALMSNSIPFYVYVITYPCPNSDAKSHLPSSQSLLAKGVSGNWRKHHCIGWGRVMKYTRENQSENCHRYYVNLKGNLFRGYASTKWLTNTWCWWVHVSKMRNWKPFCKLYISWLSINLWRNISPCKILKSHILCIILKH